MNNQYRVAWLVLGVTAAYWLGGMWGCATTKNNANHAALEDRRPAFEVDGPGLASRQEIAVELDIALLDPAQVAREAQLIEPNPSESEAKPQIDEMNHEPQQMTDTEVEPTVQSQEILPIANHSEAHIIQETTLSETTRQPPTPSISNLDRSHWPKIVIGPYDGTTQHHPYYFSDITSFKYSRAGNSPVGAESDKTITGDVLEGSQLGHHSSDENTWGLLFQPLKFGADLLLLPLNSLLHPPLSSVTTP